MLKEEDKLEIQKRLKDMKDPVRLTLFTQKLDQGCQYCTETETLLKELAELSDKIELNMLNFVTDTEAKERYGIERIPSIIIEDTQDYGIRYYGIPSGYEFATLLETVISMSKNEFGLPDELRKKVEAIDKPVHIQVFVTPTCPYCPGAAFTGYKLARYNELITADTIEVSEFPGLGQKYQVMGVPKVVINEEHSFEGALPDEQFIEKVTEAAAQQE